MFPRGLIFFIFVSILIAVVNNQFIKKREQLREELEELFGGEGAMSDFVFFEKPTPGVFHTGDKSLSNRTVLRKGGPKKAKEESKAMNVFSKALIDLRKGRNIEALTHFAELIHSQLYNKLEAESEALTLERQRRAEKRLAKKVNIFSYYFSSVFGEHSSHRDILDVLNRYQDSSRNNDNKKGKEFGYGKSTFSEKRDATELRPKSHRKLWKDQHKLKDDITYSYLSDEGVCTKKYSKGVNEGAVGLCDQCFYQIDFGSSV